MHYQIIVFTQDNIIYTGLNIDNQIIMWHLLCTIHPFFTFCGSKHKQISRSTGNADAELDTTRSCTSESPFQSMLWLSFAFSQEDEDEEYDKSCVYLLQLCSPP